MFDNIRAQLENEAKGRFKYVFQDYLHISRYEILGTLPLLPTSKVIISMRDATMPVNHGHVLQRW